MYILHNAQLSMSAAAGKDSFSFDYNVAWVDTDALGIMHFSNYFRLCERTEQLFFESRGLYESGDVFLPRVHASCDYLYPLKFRQKAKVKLSISEIGNRHVTFDYSIVNESEGKISAKCKIIVASVDKNMKPLKISSDIVKRLKGE